MPAPESLGPYKILSLLGSGGMGEVYRAHDSRLDRVVALKVLQGQLADQPDLRQRFEREARALAGLNHPHICALYDIGRENGDDYLVMECLEGESLQQKLEQGALPVDQAVLWAIQIADALDQAHRRGILHRDVKPGNIMLTGSGVKLMDFGLAKVSPPLVIAGNMAANGVLTASGKLVGTLPYMAPEQLAGREADVRTDVFALGAVLYEMIAGQRPFQGESQAGLIAAILSSEPQAPSIVRGQPGAVSRNLDHAVKQCLAKDPDERWQTVRDLMLQLEWIGESAGETDAPPPARLLRALFAWVLAGVLATVLVTLAVVRSWTAAPLAAPVELSMAPPEKNVIHSFAISPDGSRVALSASEDGKTQLWIRPLASLSAKPLPGTAGASFPFWSPDGQSLGFFAEGKLKKTTASGGTPQILCDAPNGSGGAWNSDGVILFSPGIFTGLSRISAAGGAPMPITKLDAARKDNSHRWPWFLPDGRHYIFMIRSAAIEPGMHGSPESGIYLGELGSWQNRRLVGNDSSASYSPPGKNSRLGYLLFTRGDTLMAQMVDMTKAQMLGEPILAASDVLSDSLRNRGSFSVSTNGRLVLHQFSKDASARRLVYLDRAGFQHGEALSEDTYVHVSLSPDGKRAALQHSDRGIQETWLMDLATRKSTRFAVNNTFPVWSPDGKRILLFIGQDGLFGLRHKAVNGANQSELLAPSKDPKFPLDWSADGRYVLYQQNNPETRNDLMLAPASGGAPLPYLQTTANEEDGKISPGGRWIAYTSDESGGREVYVQRFLPPGPAAASEPRWQISVRGGGKPVWSRDGRELFYIAADRNLMSVKVKSAASGIFESGPPGTLFPARLDASEPTQQYAISANGRGFFVLLPVIASPSPLTVVLDWTAVLRQ